MGLNCPWTTTRGRQVRGSAACGWALPAGRRTVVCLVQVKGTGSCRNRSGISTCSEARMLVFEELGYQVTVCFNAAAQVVSCQ
jgi:hypothetical protein